MTFDPKRRLVMATFKTVLGHNLPKGTPLTIVEKPAAAGEVDQAMAQRLHGGRMAVYEDEFRPTPVETPEQEKARLAREALSDLPPGAPASDVAPTDDLTTWQADDEGTGKKKGDRVTKDDLLAIADREGVAIESDDNKPDLIRKIMEKRASAAVVNGTNAETDGAGGQGDVGPAASTPPRTGAGADSGADGDAHGTAGEGQSDSDG